MRSIHGIKKRIPTQQSGIDQKKAFTLVEFLICLTLIAMLGTVAVFRTKDLIDRYQFDRGIERLIRQLNLTKKCALISKNDLIFQLKIQKNTLHGLRKSPIDPHDSKSSGVFSFCPISTLSFNGTKTQQLECYFIANGWLKETGIIHITYKKYQCSIDLKQTPFFTKS